MALDGSDDTAQQRHCVLDQSVWRFVSTASSSETSALQFSATRDERDCFPLCVASQRDLFVPQRVDESCHSLACPRFFHSLLQNCAAHDVCPPSPQCPSLTYLVSSESSQWILVCENKRSPQQVLTSFLRRAVTSTTSAHHAVCVHQSRNGMCAASCSSLSLAVVVSWA